LRNSLKILLKKIPFFYDFILQRKIAAKHRHVHQLLKGKPPSSSSSQKSVLHFSINKAATQHTKKVLRQLAKENMLIPIDYNGYAFATNLPYLDLLSHDEMESYKQIFRPNGYLYSVLGGMVKNIDHMDTYRIILTVRDPRDILVSKYFSTAFSHAVPEKTGNKRASFLKKREAAKNMSIDAFVLKEYPVVLSRFRAYKNELIEEYDNVTVLRYEDMITNYRGWLKRLAEGGGLNVSDPLFKRLTTEFEEKSVRSENKYRHVRKATAGDYKEKLQPETIHNLNEKFSPYMRFFGYSVDE
jgi:hypothetical protein